MPWNRRLNTEPAIRLRSSLLLVLGISTILNFLSRSLFIRSCEGAIKSIDIPARSPMWLPLATHKDLPYDYEFDLVHNLA